MLYPLNWLYESLVRSKHLQLVMIWVFVIITYLTTINGVIGYIFGSIKNASYLDILLFSVPLFFIQAFILIKATHEVFDWNNGFLLSKIIWLILLIFSFLFSAFFSYTFYYRLMSAEAYSNKILEEQINSIKNNIYSYNSSFSLVKDLMINLAEYSKNKADIEKKEGGTCGDNSTPKPGPRSRYRVNEEKVFTAQAKNIELLSKKVEEQNKLFLSYIKNYPSNDIKTINQLEEKMNQTVNTLNNFNESNPTIESTHQTLNEHYKENRKTNEKNKEGVIIACPDSEIDNKIDIIFKSFKALPMLEKVKLFDQTNTRELQERVFDIVASLTSKETNDDSTKFTINDYIALILGFLVEILIISISFIYHRENKNYIRLDRRGNYKGKFFSTKDFIDINNTLNCSINSIKSEINSAHQLDKGVIIVKSKDDDNHIVRLLKIKTPSEEFHNISYKKTLPDFIGKMESNISDNEGKLVSVYFFPRMVWRDIELSFQHLNDVV
ncbi:hypothetical protein [Thiofilum flexile]|uniref:hypothetical protein n=1 Tax=Thiofilum flexile TaxID=125627 RepID=UPI000369A08E|nr:hypothetical protein [Thiofilum flexile]